ncbi:glycosyltransferase family 28 N-terminal domain protein [Mizugakiibacter sediminis]|uniref:Glycosyltransferase family 28 N-terminal domain protein n=1 Tax=Mizugakiibacter sediminis TaxID=1475481 RepID=A0A0K8QRI2_9GAMM|nr:glycosyltransferase family 28 N-terminal domain protein [Mizugakiibacter sediminis]
MTIVDLGNNRKQRTDSMTWTPGQPVVTAADVADWQAWRKARKLEQQREREGGSAPASVATLPSIAPSGA